MARKKDSHGSSTHALAARASEWKAILRQMIVIRRFEEATEREFRRGKIGGYLHVYTGQEAVATGILASYRKGDVVYAGYRDHAHTLLLGSDPNAVMAELFGKATGISHGKGGSMHLFDAAHGFYGGYGIVGGHLTLAAGSAYALRYQETESIAICFLGDGAMNIGSFHEALNMAGIWGHQGMCPALFVIENNGYAMGTAVERHSALTDLAARFDAYAIPNEKVDGQDVVAVHALAERGVATIRETGRPFCIEAQTYRFSGHGAADILQPYRPKEEVEKQKQRDPIRLLITRLTEERLISEEEIAALESEAQQVALRAVEYAEQSPLPDSAELFTDIVFGHDWSSAETRDEIDEDDDEEERHDG